MIPLKTYNYFNNRKGKLSNSIQIIKDNNKIKFGLMTDISKYTEQLKTDYEDNNKRIGIDVGLITLFAPSEVFY